MEKIIIIIIETIIRVITILIRIAFITLVERKVLSYRQSRIGPNKVTIIGFVQPVMDGIKLLFKEILLIVKSNIILYIMSPILAIFIMLLLWLISPNKFWANNLATTFIFLLILIGLSVYTIIIIGWSSNRKYRIIGAVRSCAQSISYEIRLALIILSLARMTTRFRILSLTEYKIVSLLIIFPGLVVWLLTCLAECNRAPFDFAEGESELVSGFNVEFGRGPFALIFVAEYGIVLLFSMITGFMFFATYFWLGFVTIIIIILFIRAAYPRLRYDKLISLAWVKILPVSIFILVEITLCL